MVIAYLDQINSILSKFIGAINLRASESGEVSEFNLLEPWILYELNSLNLV